MCPPSAAWPTSGIKRHSSLQIPSPFPPLPKIPTPLHPPIPLHHRSPLPPLLIHHQNPITSTVSGIVVATHSHQMPLMWIEWPPAKAEKMPAARMVELKVPGRNSMIIAAMTFMLEEWRRMSYANSMLFVASCCVTRWKTRFVVLPLRYFRRPFASSRRRRWQRWRWPSHYRHFAK